jgi:hypothetical protein
MLFVPFKAFKNIKADETMSSSRPRVTALKPVLMCDRILKSRCGCPILNMIPAKPNTLKTKTANGISEFKRPFLKLLNAVKRAAPAEHVTDNINITAEYFTYIFSNPLLTVHRPAR